MIILTNKNKRMHIEARSLETARHIAVMTGVLNIKSGMWVSSIPEKKGGMRTYSFKYKE